MEKYAPLIFEECYVKPTAAMKQNFFADDEGESSASYRGVHLFILCHGFQGSSFDMRIFKNHLQAALPDA